jgi:hypothetical protein
MKANVRHAVYSAILVLFLGNISHAAEKNRCEVHTEAEPMLCTYEPNTIGYTHDSDDTGFMDFKLSVRYQLFPVWITRGQNYLNEGLGDKSALYFAFTGRFGQYLGVRDSSPVVGKRFNPKIFYRTWIDDNHESYVDVAFAHESNGQSIDSPVEYQAARSTSQEVNAVDDQLSRGWDYLELVWKSIPLKDENKGTLMTFVTLKYFLPYGPLQGHAEEYNAWENNPQGKPRRRVNGVAGMIKYIGKGEWKVFTDIKTAVQYETGYLEPFRFNTWRFEVGSKFLQLPVTLWWQSGYNSDLAHYYKKVNSYGIEAEIGSF